MNIFVTFRLRRHQPFGIYCQYCDCEIGVAEFDGNDQLVSVRCGCRWSILQKSDLPTRFAEWREFGRVLGWKGKKGWQARADLRGRPIALETDNRQPGPEDS